MKTSNIFMLFAQNFTTVQVVFPRDGAGILRLPPRPIQPTPKMPPWETEGADISEFVEGSVRTYTYLVDKSLGVVAGDRLIVESPSQGLVVVFAAKVDTVAKIDLDASFDYKFIVQKVDTTAYDAIIAQKEEFDEEIRAIKLEQQRENMKQEFGAQFKEGTKAGEMFASLLAGNKLIAIGEAKK